MKYFMCFAVIVAVIGVCCAHPGADADGSSFSTFDINAAAAASGAAAKTGDAAKKVDPSDAKAAMSKNAKDLNPLVVAAEITKFMATIKEACEKFFQGIFGGSKTFNPLNAGKDIFGNILKDFGGAGAPDQKDAPAAAASSAASAAASNGKSDAAAASSAAAKTGAATKKADPKDAIAAMSKNAKDLNPTVVAAQIAKFMATIEEACEKFLQGIFAGSGASPLGALPAGIPGMDEVAKMSKLFNPLDAGKDIFGNILKDFGAGASSSEQKDASAAAAGGKSAANAGKKDAEAAAPVKAATGGNDMISAMEQTGSKALSGLFSHLGF